MPDVVPRDFTDEQAAVLRTIRKMTARIRRHRDDVDARNDAYVKGRLAGLLYTEMAEQAGVSDIAVLNAAKKRANEIGVTLPPTSTRTRRASANGD